MRGATAPVGEDPQTLASRDPPNLPARIQARLSALHGVEDAPAVDPFIEPSDDERETLFVCERDGELEVRLRLPRAVLSSRTPSFDDICQAVEGVSHFLYLAERARRELPATQLELELQAEVDKYLLFARAERGLPLERAARVRAHLFERVRYLQGAGTERGDRYRLANHLAARFARRLEAMFARDGRLEPVRDAVRRFYGAGQAEKIGLAQAA